jgi:two-component system chemotaxis sensor kinase CheA
VAERYRLTPDNAAIFQDFVGEAPQLLEAMEAALLDLAAGAGQGAGPGAAQEPLNQVMRSLHTLKGISGFLGLDAMNALCHRSEGALSAYLGGAEALPGALLAWALKVLDALRAQMGLIGQGIAAGEFELLGTDALEAPAPGGPAGLAPDAAALVARPAAAERGEGPADSFIRIRVEKMDALLELVGEMAICQSQVGDGLGRLELPPAVAQEVSRLAKISRELQQCVLLLRLVPVEPLFLRASRVAHDVSQRTGKPLELLTEGKETELDKRLVEELSEPLLHLIRNAVDHGLEDAQARRAAGKPAAGRIQLRASHQGGDLLLELEDDGRGLDLGALAERGRQLGLLQAGEEQDPARVTALIFEPGFSTAAAVTDISGRGVGLDAVRTRILALKGDIQVRSRPGLGCVFSLRLPLTLALVEGILVRLGAARYVVPAGQVRKFEAFDAAQRHGFAEGGGWMESAGRSVPLLDLGALGAAAGGGQPGARQVAMHVESLGRQAVLLVDEVLGKQQVVAKGLGAGLQALDGVGGGAILGDGRVSLILDLEALMARGRAAIVTA